MSQMLKPTDETELDDLFKTAVELVVQYELASAPLLQRRLSVGYARAARILDQLERAGVVSPPNGGKPREVLIRSAEEVEGIVKVAGNSQDFSDEDNSIEFKNYKVPSGLTLSKVDNPQWEPQFADIARSQELQGTAFPLPLGYDEVGTLRAESLLDVGNLIIIGNPLSRKENLVDTILVTQLLRYSNGQIRFILIDPTHYLDLYNGVPQLLTPVINDNSRIISALRWALHEAGRRQKLFSEAGVRDISSYNALKGDNILPDILIISFISWFDVEIEDAITHLTASSQKTGIHNIIVVDKAIEKSMPNAIKSNIPARAVFRVTSAAESRAMGVSGGDKLEQAELLFKPNFGGEVKLKAVYTAEENVKEVVEAVKKGLQ